MEAVRRTFLGSKSRRTRKKDTLESAGLTTDMAAKDSYCDVCGRSMMAPSGFVLEGMRITLEYGLDDEELRQWMADHIAPYELNRTYHICWRCWLQVMGVKP